VDFDVPQNRCLDAAEREEIAGGGTVLPVGGIVTAVDLGLDVGKGKGDRVGVAVRRKPIDPRATGIAESQQLGDLIEGLTGGVVHGAADVAVLPDTALLVAEMPGKVEAGVASGDHQRQHWSFVAHHRRRQSAA
jgi:hypothetical protein